MVLKHFIYGIVIISIAAGIWPGAQAAPGGIRLQTEITDVLLFAGKALITRSGQTVYRGNNRLVVDNLPAGADADSIRVNLLGASAQAMEIKEIFIEDIVETGIGKKEAEAAEARLREIRNRISLLRNQLSAVQSNESILSSIDIGRKRPGADGVPITRNLRPDRWGTFLAHWQTEMERWLSEKNRLSDALDLAEEEHIIALAKARKLASKSSRRSKRIEIKLDPKSSPNGTSVSIALNYLIAGASWFPRYDLHADRNNPNVDLEAFALVRQQTGEDWTGVNLAFSGAEIDASTQMPELTAWYISAVDTETVNNIPNQPHKSNDARGFGPSSAPAPAMEAMKDEAGEVDDDADYYMAKPSAGAPYKRKYKKKISRSKNLYSQKLNESVEGYRARRAQSIVRELQRQEERQQAAFSSGNYKEAEEANRIILDNFNRLSNKQRNALSDYASTAKDNIQKAIRLEKGSRLNSDLVSPVKSSRGFDWRFSAMGKKHSVPSDGSFNKVPIFKRQLKAQYIYESAPLRSKYAFLALTGKNEAKRPLLAGPTAVFLGREYRGQSFLKTTAQKEEFRMYLGIDEDLPIVRRQIRKQSTSGLITEMVEFAYEVEIEVKNNKPAPQRMVLYDRFPFTTDENVEVKLSKVELGAGSSGSWDEEGYKQLFHNLLELKLDLPGRTKRKITITYTVKHPKDYRLNLQGDGYAK